MQRTIISTIPYGEGLNQRVLSLNFNIFTLHIIPIFTLWIYIKLAGFQISGTIMLGILHEIDLINS